jgi:cob(I)alamin adenosyltransferase
MNKFYTQTGDDGFTSLLGEGRVEKSHARIEAIGSIDEASAAIGFARRVSKDNQTDEILLDAQRDLYLIMAEIAATPENAERFRKIEAPQIDLLEENLERISKHIEIPAEFIIPGDSLSGAAIAIARTVVRRAERRVAQLLISNEITNPYLLQYLNRLSSLCFALELYENQIEGQGSPTLAKA